MKGTSWRESLLPGGMERGAGRGEARSELVVSSQPLFFTTLMALRITAFFGITGP